MATIVYKYGLLPPISGGDHVRAQLKAAGEYRNKLVEIERSRRAQIRAFLSSCAMSDPDSATGVYSLAVFEESAKNAEALVDATLGEIRAERRKSRSRSESDAAKTLLKTQRALLKERLGRLYKARKAVMALDTTKAKIAEINAEHVAMSKKARGETETYWGTYLLVEDAMSRSRNMPLYESAGPNDPRFARNDGTGRLGVQIQKGIAAPLLFGEDNRLRIAHYSGPPPVNPRTGRPRRVGRNDYRMLWFRAASDGRAPKWAVFPLFYSRPFPLGAVITWATIVHYRIANRDRWEVHFTLNVPAPEPTKLTNAVAIDLGWRVVNPANTKEPAAGSQGGTKGPAAGADGGTELAKSAQNPSRRAIPRNATSCEELAAYAPLTIGRRNPILPDHEIRVATWYDENGQSGELRLPQMLIGHLRVADAVQAVRDRLFNNAKSELAQAIKRLKTAPDWLTTAAATISHWRSKARLAGLLCHWGENRFDGDERIWYLLADPKNTDELGHRADWLGKDIHLWRWEEGARVKARRARLDFYRVFAKTLGAQYGTVVLEKFNIAKIARRGEERDNETAHSNRQLVAVSELRRCIEQAFAKVGGHVAGVSAIQSTHECAACKHVDKFDAAANIYHACSACGAVWDQDYNASEVLLARWKMPPDPNEKPSEEKKPRTSRWKRLKEEKTRKDAAE